jgi:hypothetical protein
MRTEFGTENIRQLGGNVKFPPQSLRPKRDGRFQPFGYDKLIKRNKTNLDICWLRGESLEGSPNLPAPT